MSLCDLVCVREGGEVFVLDGTKVVGEVFRCFGEEVLCGQNEESRWEKKAGKDEAVAADDGAC